MTDLSNITQVVGAIGVILSVLYLALQIKHSTTLSQSETLQTLTTRVCDRILSVTTDESLARLIAADWNSEELTKVERLRIFYWVYAVLTDLRDIYHHYELKIIPYEILIGRTQLIKKGMFKTAIGQRVWEEHKDAYDANFVKWFEETLTT